MYNTFTQYSGNNQTTDFAIPFQYDHVIEVVVTSAFGNGDYTFLNPQMIRLSTPLASGDTLTIQRVTDLTEPAVEFNGTLRNEIVEDAFEQVYKGLQELNDKAGTASGALYQVDSIEAHLNGATTFHLWVSGKEITADLVGVGTVWFVVVNGLTLEKGVDYVINNADNATSIQFLTDIPVDGDTVNISFIRLLPSAGGGSGSGGTATPGNTDGGSGIDIVSTTPTTCSLDGKAIYNSTDKKLYICQGGQYVDIFAAYTPNAPTPVQIVNGVPASCTLNGGAIYDTVTQQLYICKDGVYVSPHAAYTPDAPTGIEIVDTLPTVNNFEGRVVFNRADNKLYRFVSGNWVQVVEATTAAADVADGAVTTAKFAAGLTAVEIKSALPTTGNFVGRMVYLTTDNKLYRYTGSTFSPAVNAADISGQLATGQIAANAITTGLIAAGAVKADQISSGEISTDKLAAGAVTATKIAALSIDSTKIIAGSIGTDQLAANSITAGKIQASAIGTTQLAASAVTADKIASNSITAALIQAGAIGTSQLSAGAVTADKIAANAITVGTAQIADASITTLKIAGEAVMIPRSYNNQGTITGNGSTSTIATVTFTLPYAASVLVLFNANQAYSGTPIADSTLALYLDGAVISGVSNGGGQASTSPTMAGFRSLSAGTHTASVAWYGQNGLVQIGNVTLSIFGAMR